MRILYRERGHLVLDLRPIVYPVVEWAGYWYSWLGMWLGLKDSEKETRRAISTMDLKGLVETELWLTQVELTGGMNPERVAEVRAWIHHRRHQLEEEVTP